MTTVCQTKRHFDSEFEAVIAASRIEEKYGEEMVPYRCWPLGHWHLTHKDRNLRRGVGKAFEKCNDCGMILKRSKMEKHKRFNCKNGY